MKKIVSVLFSGLVFYGSTALSQGVFINSTPFTSDIQMFMLSDFNFTGRGTSSTEIFELTLSNLSQDPKRCYLRLSVQAEMFGPMASGETDPFLLQPGEVRRITNRNMFSQAQQFTLQNYQISDIGNKLTSELLSTGRLPADVYFFVFKIYDAGTGVEYDQTTIRFNLTNPRMIQLISPGTIATAPDEARVFTPYPLFRWDSDMSAFRLIVAEKLDDAQDDISPEEIMQQRVVFERTMQVSHGFGGLPGAELIPATLYQYPVIGARALEEGKTYYWQVIGLVPTSAAPQEFPSEIYKFKAVGFGAARMLTPLQQQILNLVRELNPDLLKPGGELDGFIPTEIVKKNGSTIPDQEIIDILSKLVNKDFETLDISVE